MAIVKTKKIFVYGLNTDRKAILEELHKKEVVEISDMDVSGSGLKRQETLHNVSQLDRMINSTQEALTILDKYAPQKSGLFSSRTLLPMSKYGMKSGNTEQAQKTVYEIIQLSDKIHENAENMRRIDAKQLALGPYLKLDAPMKTIETKTTGIQSGWVPRLWTVQDIDRALEENDLSDVYFEILGAGKEQTSIWFMYPKDKKKEIGAFFQSIGFQEPSFSLSHRTPTDKVAVLEEAKKDLAKKSAEYEKEIAAYGKERKEIELLHDHLTMRRDKYRALAKVGLTDSTFVLEGYILAPVAEGMKRLLEEKYNAYVELSEPDPAENAPISFHNNGFAVPVEGITEMYSMPGRGEVDPNPIMAFFYYFFFGMMFSDAGYGIMVMIACGLLGYGKFMEASKRGMFKMFFFCGISTTFWGIMYGSFFGDAVSAFSNGQYAFKPLWIDPVSEPMMVLIVAIAFGLVHIMVGLGIKAYQDAKQGDLKGAIFDTGSWMIILGGIAVLAIGAAMGNNTVLYAGVWVAVAGLVLLVATHGRHNKNPIMKVLGGIIGIYDITGYVGDILSYSRLMALGLTTGVIASVINLLGPVFGDLVFGNSPFPQAGTIIVVIIFIFGHLVNFAINMLGAYVHTNRLQYVEFFSKFYDGGGRKFAPLKMDTKYYKFSEKTQERGM